MKGPQGHISTDPYHSDYLWCVKSKFIHSYVDDNSKRSYLQITTTTNHSQVRTAAESNVLDRMRKPQAADQA